MNTENIKELLHAVSKIVALREKQKARTEQFRVLAKETRLGLISAFESKERLRKLDETQVVDFSTAIDELCDAFLSLSATVLKQESLYKP